MLRDDFFFSSIKDFLHDGKFSSAIDLCENTDTPVARILKKGIIRFDRSLDNISQSISNEGKLELSKLENNLATLATISGSAPMIGFLGTVIGMVLAFYEMASSGGQIDIEMLSKGIYTAMTTTVAGLIVGIMAYLSYNYLVSKISRVVFEIESTGVFAQDGIFWQFLAYCAGTGGSVLIIGSAAGVAVMGILKIDFMWYLKKISFLALIGYVWGALTYILLGML